MNNMTVTEASRNFSQITKATDQDGAIELKKNGVTKYVIMTKEVYDRMTGKTYYGKHNEEIIKAEITGERAKVYSVAIEQDNEIRHLTYTIVEMPARILEITEKGSDLKIAAELSEKASEERTGYTVAEAFLDKDGKSLFLPENPTEEADLHEAALISKCLGILKEAERIAELKEIGLEITREGKSLI